MNKILFLDRDGVINVDSGHVYKIEDFVFMDGIFDLCKLYMSKGYIIIIVTNQAGIAKGLYTEEDLDILHNYMLEKFEEKGITITDIFYCPHHPDEDCACRKPKPGLFYKAFERYECDLRKSIMIGDKMSDLIAANNAGIKNLIFLRGKYEKKPVAFDYTEIIKLSDLIKLG